MFSFSQEERNRYIRRRYDYFHNLCLNIARRVQHRCNAIELCDLIAFAHEGVIHAVDNAHESDSLAAYYYRTTYFFTLQKAYTQLGYRRIRGDENRHLIKYETIACEADKLEFYLEASQAMQSVYSKDVLLIFSQDAQSWLLDTIEMRYCYERLVLRFLIFYTDCDLIAHTFQVHKSDLRGTLKRIHAIYRLADSTLSYDDYLTPIPNQFQRCVFHPKIYMSFSAHSSMGRREGAFHTRRHLRYMTKKVEDMDTLATIMMRSETLSKKAWHFL